MSRSPQSMSPHSMSPHSTFDRNSLAPPRTDRWGPSMAKALVVHGLLIGALTWGVQWNKDVELATVEAELWSRVPQQAAPRAVEPPPPPPAPPAPAPRPEPRPAPPPPGPTEAEIATAKAREKAQAEKREAELRAAEKREADRKAAAEKAAADRKAAAEKERQQKLAEDKKRAEVEKREAQLKEQLRQDQLRRMMGQAGATGGPQSTGTAQQSSGPTPGYGAKVAARIKPNVVFTDVAPGNPRAEVEVRTLPDGTITGRKITKSSGNAAWDEAVLRAIDRTGSLPRDTDGRVPPALVIGLRPLD